MWDSIAYFLPKGVLVSPNVMNVTKGVSDGVQTPPPRKFFLTHLKILMNSVTEHSLSSTGFGSLKNDNHYFSSSIRRKMHSIPLTNHNNHPNFILTFSFPLQFIFPHILYFSHSNQQNRKKNIIHIAYMTANKILFFIKGRSDSLSCVKPLIHYLTEQLFLHRKKNSYFFEEGKKSFAITSFRVLRLFYDLGIRKRMNWGKGKKEKSVRCEKKKKKRFHQQKW